jgi:hypothetical protein
MNNQQANLYEPAHGSKNIFINPNIRNSENNYL